jgi:hypothetical protein
VDRVLDRLPRRSGRGILRNQSALGVTPLAAPVILLYNWFRCLLSLCESPAVPS